MTDSSLWLPFGHHARGAGHHSRSVLGLEQTGTAGEEDERHAYSDRLRGQQRPEEHTVRLATSSLLKTAQATGKHNGALRALT